MDERKKIRKEAALLAFGKLIDIIDTLRSPGGCPWDLKQTHASLKPYIIEESYEVLDAIDSGNRNDLREELGDLLLQIMLQSQIAFENRDFHVGDVADGLSEKMVVRHPHVFSDTEVDGADEVLANWEKIKASQKEGRGLFDGLPTALPGLLKAFRMGQKAKRVGFDWPDIPSVRAKVVEELAELDDAVANGTEQQIEHEIGDLLFAVAQWSRHLNHDPEEAIRKCCERFKTRFGRVRADVEQSGKTLEECSIVELEELWQKAKQHESDN